MKTTTPTSWRYLAQETALLLVLTILLFFSSSHNGLVQPQVLALTSVILGVLALSQLIFSRRLPGAPVDLPAVAFLAILLLTSLASIDPRRSLTETWLVGIMVFLFLLAIRLVQTGWPAELIIKILLIIGAIFMGFAWVEVALWYQKWFQNQGWAYPGLTFRLSIPNFYAVFLNVLLMMAISRLVASRGKTPRFLLAAWILSALALIFFTSSRGGWLGTIAGLGTLFGLTVFREKSRVIAVVRWLGQRRIFTAFLVFVLIIGLSLAGILAYKQVMHPTHSPLESARGYLWGPAWHAFLRSPLFGEGIYTFFSHYIREHSVPPGMLFVYAHSIYLDLLSGSGLLGLAGFLWLVGVVISLLRTRLLNAKEFPDLTVGGLAALAALGVHGIIDSVHHTIPTCGWLIAIVMGAVVGDASINSQSKSRKTTAYRVDIALGLLVAIAGGWNAWAAAPLSQGVESGNAGLWQQAVDAFKIAVERDPDLAIGHQQLALAYSVLAEKGEETALAEAIQEMETAAALDPDWGLNHANLGALYRESGELEKAQTSLQTALQCAPQAWLYALNLGMVEEDLGHDEPAIDAYRRAIKYMPAEFSAAYFWRSTGIRRMAVAGMTAGQTLSEESLPQLEEAVENTSLMQPFLQLAEAYLDLDRLEDAEKMINLSGLAVPQESDVLERRWLIARLAAKQGDYPLAAENGLEALDGYRVQGVFGPGSYGSLLYAPLIFRRPELAMEVAAQFSWIPLPDRWAGRAQELAGWLVDSGQADMAEAILLDLKQKAPDL